jgi:uncharacterized membrane protein YoaK (UPF0700 family)
MLSSLHAISTGGLQRWWVVRKLLSILLFALGAYVLGGGFYSEYFGSRPDEPFFGPGQAIILALIISFVIFLVSYLLWPKRAP